VVDFHSAASARENVVNSIKMKVIVIEPKTFDDAQQVANNLREKKPVVINFEKTKQKMPSVSLTSSAVRPMR
jgi:cell division inhibitor SepF